MVWITLLVGGSLGVVQKVGFAKDGFLTGVSWLAPVTKFVQAYTRTVDVLFGITVVVTILLIAQLMGKRRPEWDHLQNTIKRKQAEAERGGAPSTFPALVMGYCLCGLALMMLCLAPLNTEHWMLLTFTALVLIALGVFFIRVLAAQQKEPISNSPLEKQDAG